MDPVKYVGFAFFTAVVLGCAAALVGVILYSRTPCYKGALKATGSHALALRMASACNNDGKPWPLSAPPKMMSLIPIEEDKEGKAAVQRKQRGLTGFLWGSFTAFASIVLAALVFYFAKTRGAKGAKAMEQMQEHGQEVGAIEEIISNLNDGVPLSFDEMDALAEQGATNGMAGAPADTTTLKQTMTELNNAGVSMGDQVDPDAAKKIPELKKTIDSAKATTSAKQQQTAEDAEANKTAAAVFFAELEEATSDVSVLGAMTSGVSASFQGVKSGVWGFTDWLTGKTAAQNAEDAQSDKFTKDPYAGYIEDAMK